MQRPILPIEGPDGNPKILPGKKSDRVRVMSQTETSAPVEPPTAEIVSPPTPTGPQKDATPPPPPKEKTFNELYDEFLNFMLADDPLSNRADLNKSVAALLAHVSKQHDVSEKYRLVLMYDNLSLMRQDTDKIYRCISAAKETKKPIALIIHSGGGEVDAAYLVGKLCREFSPDHFIAIVPRRAKSAGTLICCGADQIHMGSMSELGPIDPQIGGMPALGLKNAVEHLLDLAGQFPKASDVLSKYLASSLELINLGYQERVAESAKQYAERLLKRRKVSNGFAPESIADTLVYSYKDHEFVIDSGEAASIFGPDVVIVNSAEYNMANSLYGLLSSIESMASAAGCGFYLYGSLDSAPNFYKKKK